MCNRDNYFLYQQLLKSEFNYEWRPSDLPITAKDVYQKFHRVRLDVYARPESWPHSYTLVQDDNVSDDVRSSIDKRFISDKRPYDYISIPMEGSIYIGAENQWVMYVRGKPRTAILIEIDYSENDDPYGIHEIAYGWNDGGPDDKAIVYMSSNDLRDFIGNRQIVFLDAESRPMPNLFLGKPPTLGDYIMYLVTNNVPYAKVLLDGQEETIVTIPINKQGLL